MKRTGNEIRFTLLIREDNSIENSSVRTASACPSLDLPAELESADLAKRLPKATSRYVEIGDASHFSFLPTCKAGAVELLEEDSPGDGIICSDGENARPRAMIQQQVTLLISDFLTQAANTKEER